MSNTTNQKASGSTGRMGLLATLLAFFAAACAWAISLPPGASPDEPDHFIRAAAVVRGQVLGSPGEETWLREVQVPEGIRDSRAWLCYSGNSLIDASCVPHLEAGDPSVTAVTSAGLYNPVYYGLVGLPTLLDTDPQTALYLSRMLSALWCAAAIAVAFAFMRKLHGLSIAGLTTIAVMSPMALFLSGTLNPSGLEICAAFAASAGALYLARSHGTPSFAALAAFGTAAALLATVRGLGVVWLFVIAVVFLVMTPRERLRELLTSRRVLVLAGVVLVIVLASSAWTLGTGTLGAMGKFPGAGDASPPIAFLVILSRTIAPGLVGYFAWHDVHAPSFAYFAYAVVVGLTVLLAFWWGSKRQLRPLWIALGAWLLIPPAVQAMAIGNSGYIWQTRYGLPTLATVVVLAGSIVAVRLASTTPSQTILARALPTLGALALVAHLGSMQTVQRRFGVSMSGTLDGAYTGPVWNPPGTALLWIAVLTISLGAWVTWVALRPRELAVGTTETAD